MIRLHTALLCLGLGLGLSLAPTVLTGRTQAAATREGAEEHDVWRKIGLDGVHVVALASDPVRAETLYAVTSLGLQRSADSGASWSAAGPGLPTRIPPSCVAVNPHDSRMLFVGFDGLGLFKSADRGETWQDVGRDLPNPYVRSLIISQKDPNLLYLGIQGGVAISTNGGENWHMSSGFRRGVNVNVVVADPRNPQYLYAGTGGAGVYKSGNGGVSWRDVNDGLSSLSILDLHVDADDPDIVLAGAYHPATPTDLYVGEASGGVYRSGDGGRTWQETELTSMTPFAFAASPDHPGTVYVGAWGGVYRSLDNGRTWTDLNSGLDNAFVHAVHALPGSPPVILAGTTYGLLAYQDAQAEAARAGSQRGGQAERLAPWLVGGGVVLLILLGTGWLRRRANRTGSRDGRDDAPVW